MVKLLKETGEPGLFLYQDTYRVGGGEKHADYLCKGNVHDPWPNVRLHGSFALPCTALQRCWFAGR